MAGHCPKRKHRETQKGSPTPPPEYFEETKKRIIEEGRAMHEKIFTGENGEMIDADQFLQEFFGYTKATIRN